MSKKKKHWLDPIDLGLGAGKGFVIDLGLPKLEPCIPNENKPSDENKSLIFGLGGFAEDVSKTIHDTRKDYEQFKKSAELMKQDITPTAKKTWTLAKKAITWFKNLKHYKRIIP